MGIIAFSGTSVDRRAQAQLMNQELLQVVIY